MSLEDDLRRQIRDNSRRIRDLGEKVSRNQVPAGVVQPKVGDLLCTQRGRESLYRVVRLVPGSRWAVVFNLWSGIETRRKLDDFEMWGES